MSQNIYDTNLVHWTKPILNTCFLMKNLLLILLLLIVTSLHCQEIITGKAVKVYDGDTFTLVTDSNQEIRVRVVGIDAPEKNQEHGIESRDFARRLIENKTVTVYLESGETYGRKLAVVITSSGKHFNYEMVVNGHAWHYNHYNSDKFLSTSQNMAKNNKIGLWASDSPVAPWDWKKIISSLNKRTYPPN